jgi:hypothetical protein
MSRGRESEIFSPCAASALREEVRACVCEHLELRTLLQPCAHEAAQYRSGA